MAKKRAARRRVRNGEDDGDDEKGGGILRLSPDVRRSVWGVLFLGASSVLILASLGYAGPVGEAVFESFSFLFGFGYYLVPLIFGLLGFTFLTAREREFIATVFLGALLFVLSGLGAFDILFPGSSGVVGAFVGGVKVFFGYGAGLAIACTALAAGALVSLNIPVRLRFSIPRFGARAAETSLSPSEARVVSGAPPSGAETTLFSHPTRETTRAAQRETKAPIENRAAAAESVSAETFSPASAKIKKLAFKNYIPPPLSLLRSSVDKPTAGDLRTQANIIKRTLESFGIPVEMGEITIGPKVTRYTLKPAEGIKLTRITALNQDLALALAAHPLRIEAPIPGKSLVGLEVPNKTAAIVRLGSILGYPEFTNSPHLTFAIGRDIAGEPIFSNIAKMPHLLIAGSTGSGKSVAIHSLITSLLYNNSPETLQLILIDPKRVELSIYRGLPHLASPVITEGKKAIAVLRWAIGEMDRRYERLLEHSCRDIQSYNTKFEERGFPEGHERMPYLLIVLDELADLMTAYGREVEASIVRLAQMARATGIHLVVSTQRPSVEVITGLI
ncbi:MAG: hypothetical protein HY536_01405, partial [Candidatus Colwellbacteria bacterium]|nr:hypothetical protein [Candidatus Colwellbacteria bacterium]